MIKRYIISMIVAVALVLGVFVYYDHLDLVPGQIKVGATYMNMNNKFYVILNEEVEKAVNSHDDILMTCNPCLSESKQCEQIDQLLKQNIDVLIINPVDGASDMIMNHLRQAKDKGVKIIVVDSPLKDDTISDCTIVSDNYGAGRHCARDMMKHRKHAKVLMIGHETAYSANERVQGFKDAIKDHPNYRIVEQIDGRGTTEFSMPLVQDIIRRKVDFDVIMAINDPSALGALAALESGRVDKDIFVYSVDGSPDVKKLISHSNGLIATCAQSPIRMGQATADKVYELKEGIPIEKTIVIPVMLLNDQNSAQYNVTGWQ